jgi:tetratricopeptide (TPR) repeat protein
MSRLESFWRNAGLVIWLIVVVPFSIYWWQIAGQGEPRRVVLLAALGLASFSVGSVAGFLFTSYGEEQGTLGKIRDWIIGGVTGLGLAEAIEQGGTLKRILHTFQFSDGTADFGLVISVAVVYCVLGFFFMFFQRELTLNVSLATRRAERGRLDGTHQAGLALQQITIGLPASVLTGIDDVFEIDEENREKVERLQIVLYSLDVEKFVSQADQATHEGIVLDWDAVSKTAYIHYYRSYFEKKESAERSSQISKALEWIQRALFMNPLHVDLTMKYADMLALDEQYEPAVAILERLNLDSTAPMTVKQWLGYFLLFLPDRINDAIKFSESFLAQFPDDSYALFNLSCGFAQLYCEEAKFKEGTVASSTNRQNALKYLKDALTLDPDFATTVRDKWTVKGESFDCFKKDDDFNKLIRTFEDEEADTLRIPGN